MQRKAREITTVQILPNVLSVTSALTHGSADGCLSMMKLECYHLGGVAQFGLLGPLGRRLQNVFHRNVLALCLWPGDGANPLKIRMINYANFLLPEKVFMLC